MSFFLSRAAGERSPLCTPRSLATTQTAVLLANALIQVHHIAVAATAALGELVASSVGGRMAPLGIGLVLESGLDALTQQLLLAAPLLAGGSAAADGGDLGVEVGEGVVAAGLPGGQLGDEGGDYSRGEVAQRGDGGDGDAGGGRVKRAGDEVRVDGLDEQVLERARRGDVERGAQVVVGQLRRRLRGEWEEREQFELLRLRDGQRGEGAFGGCCGGG